MAKTYKGSLSLEWYNKQKSILLKSEDSTGSSKDIPAPQINWVNKDEALFYEIVDEVGRGLKPYWVDRNDIRVKEARPLIFQKAYKAIETNKPGTLPGTYTTWEIEESNEDDTSIENILIKGDNLLALNVLKKIFDNKQEDEKVKCIYIDPPYNTKTAFEHYEDNLAHSEWLSLIRDRLVILRELLRNDGFIFLQLDDKEVHYAKALMDEIFGRENYRNSIYWKRTFAGKTVSKNLPSNVDTILLYSKNPDIVLSNVTAELSEKDISSYNKDDVDGRGKYSTVSMQKTGNPTKGTIYDYVTNDGRVFKCPDKGWRMIYEKMKALENDNRLYFTENTIREKYYLRERLEIGKQIDNFWGDIGNLNRNKKEESGFTGGQKPEGLIERVIELCTSDGDVILDCFGGSGTTFAVAHKMHRIWIGVEVGDHADNIIIPRMKDVLKGKPIGISNNQNWGGGGFFKYYHLGPSIISQDANGEFNWLLGRKFIEESLLLSYDYVLDTGINLLADQLFQTKEAHPTIGIQKIGTKTRVAIVSLNEPEGNLGIMPYEEITAIYKAIKQRLSPEYINIFTNRGIEIAYDSKPDDLEIIKVPHAIFAELEK